MRRRLTAWASLATAFTAAAVLAAGPPNGLKFYPDDPIWTDPDRAVDVGTSLPAIEAANIYDFVENTFQKPGERADVPAQDLNTVDEVPDSSWFTNRIGRKEMSVGEIVRGPDRFDKIDIQNWPIVGGKIGGIQPGYRVTDPDGHIWQVEFDPPSNPEMASGAEMIGTAFYHDFAPGDGP
jgi:hypothetical protein